jgi:hypothetical protein
VVFSWHLAEAYERATQLKTEGFTVWAGGPAVYMQPKRISYVALIGHPDHPAGADAIARHNPHATLTTRGCIRRCHFCIVPKIEPDFQELDDWPVRPIVADNNLLASSKAHFERVIERLKPVKNVDIQSGLDVRLLTKWHADLLTQLDHYRVRLAWDNTRTEKRFMRAFQILLQAGIPVRKITVYCLIGYTDTPDDAWYRLHKVTAMGAKPFPMRYQQLKAERRNDYVGKHWNDRELKRYCRYWSNLRRTGSIPFEEFAHRGEEPDRS